MPHSCLLVSKIREHTPQTIFPKHELMICIRALNQPKICFLCCRFSPFQMLSTVPVRSIYRPGNTGWWWGTQSTVHARTTAQDQKKRQRLRMVSIDSLYHSALSPEATYALLSGSKFPFNFIIFHQICVLPSVASCWLAFRYRIIATPHTILPQSDTDRFRKRLHPDRSEI